MDPTMASIMIFAGNFAPLSWAYCNGALLSIAENTALFSLLGTTYGGDGQTTFALPDLRGRIPVGTGGGPGLSFVDLGEVSGSEAITLTLNNLPSHSHAMTAAVSVSSGANDGSKNPAELLGSPTNAIYAPANAGSGQLGGVAVNIGVAGGSQPFSILQPYLALNYIICTEGIYPSRN